MSASLVGSEMCIRDSRGLQRLALRRCCCAPLCVGVAAFALFSDARPDAVSYTHLTLPTICSV
eukprot:6588273-Alexandrium_andersonii.AAC.1